MRPSLELVVLGASGDSALRVALPEVTLSLAIQFAPSLNNWLCFFQRAWTLPDHLVFDASFAR
ncbi:hypothetical protein [Variovorax guangxiensis]|uniref:Uncharacterized protein n=1 Tax=Variovorax guangxiensis TaxID=1775474 RepID=A0A840FX33_9BURK|nr:hypothetical protein [Variovorax guangxiensis]MBB4224854.1 hypothetical protein [Variovorax guangxiensis]